MNEQPSIKVTDLGVGGALILDAELKRLADFIIAEIPGEPSQSQGAVDTAIRLLRKYSRVVDAAKAMTQGYLIESWSGFVVTKDEYYTLMDALNALKNA